MQPAQFRVLTIAGAVNTSYLNPSAAAFRVSTAVHATVKDEMDVARLEDILEYAPEASLDP